MNEEKLVQAVVKRAEVTQKEAEEIASILECDSIHDIQSRELVILGAIQMHEKEKITLAKILVKAPFLFLWHTATREKEIDVTLNRLQKVCEEMEANESIRVYDYSNYEYSSCCNGGNYGFTTKFSKVQGVSKWVVTHHTTADFSYCTNCGSFYQYGDYQHEHCSPETVTTLELLERLLREDDTTFFSWWFLDDHQKYNKVVFDLIQKKGLNNIPYSLLDQSKWRAYKIEKIWDLGYDVPKIGIYENLQITASPEILSQIPDDKGYQIELKYYGDIIGDFSIGQAIKLSQFMPKVKAACPVFWKAKNAFKNIKEKGIENPEIDVSGEFTTINWTVNDYPKQAIVLNIN